MCHEGTIGIQIGKENNVKYAHYWAKVLDEPSKECIDGGKILQLTIKTGGKYTCQYDKGWEIKPEDTDMVTQIALGKVIKTYN